MKKTDLERKIILDDFESKYHPLKINSELRRLEIPVMQAKYLSDWYEDIFYKKVMDIYQREKTKRIWNIK